MKYVLGTIVFGALCFAGDGQKPACNAAHQGMFWPEEANTSQEAQQKLTRSGELEMCSRTPWKYRWQHLSVNIKALEAKHPAPKTGEQPKPPASPAER
jgi:hypothetical protein